MSARTAARRRRQAVQNYNHLARIGRGNNNRPIYHKRSVATLTQREAAFRERQKQLAARKGKKR